MGRLIKLNDKNEFFVWFLLYHGTIFWYFFGHCMLKECLYGKKCKDMEILFVKLVVYMCNMDLQINFISFEVIYWVIDGVFINGCDFVKKDFFAEMKNSVQKW